MPDPSQADILAALASQSSASSSRKRTSTVPFESLSLDQLIDPTPVSQASIGEGSKNKRRVYCFREGCACLILLPEAGEVIQTEEPILPDDAASPFPSQSSSSSTPPSPDATTTTTSNLYLRVPTAFDFENVGYSRPASGDASTLIPATTPGLDTAPIAPAVSGTGTHLDGPAAKKVKWLICADCDLGPIGWGFEGGQEAYLDMRRCRYAAQ